MAKVVVAKASDIPAGERRFVEVKQREICIFNLGGDYFAIGNRCPHAGGKLCYGDRVGLVESDSPRDYKYTRQGEILKCPWHGWEFDIRTGRSVCDPRGIRVRSYPVTSESGEAIRADGSAELVLDTYEVSVEEDYVCLNI